MGGVRAEPTTHIVSRSDGGLPNGSSVNVQAESLYEETDEILVAISKGLIDHGYKTADNGTYILEFDIDDSVTIENDAHSNVTLQGQIGSSTRSGTNIEANINIVPREKLQTARHGALQISMVLFQDGKPPIWSASITSSLSKQSKKDHLVRMAASLIRSIGKNEERKVSLFE